MRVLILTLGTRGDVQPIVALGAGLQQAGHEVTLCTSVRFEPMIRAHSLQYGWLNNDFMDFMDSPEARALMEKTTNWWALLRAAQRFQRQLGPMQRRTLAAAWQTTQQAQPELILYHPKMFAGPDFAEKLQIPAIQILLAPLLVPTGTVPNSLFPPLPLGRAYNRLTYHLGLWLTQWATRRFIQEWRSENGLVPMPRQRTPLQTATGAPIPVLHGYSPSVVPVPPDWPETATVSGYWFLDAPNDWQPSVALRDFLANGTPPIYFGFGSIAGQHPERVTQMIRAAVQAIGKRAILATGWGGLVATELPEHLFLLDEAPHDWLFPQMAAVVHHGGAGTTAAGLRAGRPTLICPFFGDQLFWGKRVADLGVGPKPIPQGQLRPANFTTALRDLTANPNYLQRAATLSQQIRQEDGIGQALQFIERFATNR